MGEERCIGLSDIVRRVVSSENGHSGMNMRAWNDGSVRHQACAGRRQSERVQAADDDSLESKGYGCFSQIRSVMKGSLAFACFFRDIREILFMTQMRPRRSARVRGVKLLAVVCCPRSHDWACALIQAHRSWFFITRGHFQNH